MEHDQDVKTNGHLANGYDKMEKSATTDEVSPDLNGCDTGAIFYMEDEDHQSVLLNSLNMMRKSRTFCDVILNVGNCELYGHRAVLASSSRYLMEMFSADYEEKKGSQREAITTYTLNATGPLNDRTAVEKLVEYTYTSRLEANVCQVKSIFQAACYLKMDRITKELGRFMLKNLSVDNCIEIRSLPCISTSISFISQVNSFIMAHMKEVAETSAFLSLPCVRIEILSQTKQEMSLSTGDSISELVLDWIKRCYDENEPTIFLNTLMEKTYMLYLALDNILQDCSELPSGELSDTEIVQDYKKMSMKSTSIPKARRKGQIQPAKSRVLICNREIHERRDSIVESDWTIIGVTCVGEHTFSALGSLKGQLCSLSIKLKLNVSSLSSPPSTQPSPLNSRAESQESLPDLYCALAHMTSGKCAVGCANFNNNLLVCGGYDRTECIKSVESYDPEQNIWETFAPMCEARGRFDVAVFNNKVYAIGGCNGTTELATVECYDLKNKKWTPVTSLPLARSNTGVCELNGKIYCIGGWNGQVGIKQCDVYDPDTNQWTSIASLQTGRNQAGVCAMNGKVYVVGGCDTWNCLNTVECYDPETNSWSFIKPIITPRRGCGLAHFNGKLYVVGGSDGTQSLTTTEVYDTEERIWSPGPNMTTPRANVGVAVIGNRLYAVGGFSGKKFLNSIEFLDETMDEWTQFSPRHNNGSLSSSPLSTNNDPIYNFNCDILTSPII
ncbi:influenza virus NS1A-binding protein-like isoform X1 [Adelges cooleyi]|uniref:influenza virus NS1A-binding protein-like isoform X1 n=2 Tax=Adelges cooleyi TaxID=133065 RepID=UPI00217F7465|nr:influenza virus NS1A-binding protein-like isoform X1 [Adelges cooleyi]